MTIATAFFKRVMVTRIVREFIGAIGLKRQPLLNTGPSLCVRTKIESHAYGMGAVVKTYRMLE